MTPETLRKRDKKAIVKVLQVNSDLQKKFEKVSSISTPLTKLSGTPTSFKCFSDKVTNFVPV